MSRGGGRGFLLRTGKVVRGQRILVEKYSETFETGFDLPAGTVQIFNEEFNDFVAPAGTTQVFNEEFNDFAVPPGTTQVFNEEFDDFT